MRDEFALSLARERVIGEAQEAGRVTMLYSFVRVSSLDTVS